MAAHMSTLMSAHMPAHVAGHMSAHTRRRNRALLPLYPRSWCHVTCEGAYAGGAETVYVDKFTDGVLDPSKPFLGPVKDGGYSSLV